MSVPASRYRVSPRGYEEKLAEIEYGAEDHIRKVQQGGKISFKGQDYKVSKAFCGEYVALRPTSHDGVLEVFFCNRKIAQIDMRVQE